MKRIVMRLVCLLMIVGISASVLPVNPAQAANAVSVSHTQTRRTRRLKAPALSKAENVNGGIKLSWKKVSGAAKYRILYRVNGKGSWKKLAETAKLTYTWKKAKPGVKYSFTVQCLNKKSNAVSSYNRKGMSVTYIAAPALKPIRKSGIYPVITWNASKGAVKFRVFRKTTGGWQKLGDTTKKSWTDKKAVPGVKYTYTVRCVSSNGKWYTSGYNATGKTVSISLPAPKLVSAVCTGNTVTLSWNKVTGAAKYQVYYKTNGGWKVMGRTASCSYKARNLNYDTLYSFTVRCVNSKGALTGSYSKTGISLRTGQNPKQQEQPAVEPLPQSAAVPEVPSETEFDIPSLPAGENPAQGESGAERLAREEAERLERERQERIADENRRTQEAGAAIEALNAVYLQASNYNTLQLSDEVFFRFQEVFCREQIVRNKYFDYMLNKVFRKIPTDEEIQQIRQSTQNLEDLMALVRLPSSQAVFDPSKLVYYRTESMKLHEMFNAFRVENGRKTTEWLDLPADCARVQASYNVLASVFLPRSERANGWTSASHCEGQIGTNSIHSNNESTFASDAYQAFLNSPMHKSNVLAMGIRGNWEGIAIVGYTHHGFHHVVCIADCASVNPQIDGFTLCWNDHIYATASSGKWFELFPGCTCENVKNCQVK